MPRILFQTLEQRVLLFAGSLDPATPLFTQPTIDFAHHVDPQDENSPAIYTGSPSGFTPAQIRQAYGLNNLMFGSITADGAGQTIAIICAYDNPKFVNSSDPNYNTSDLYKFNDFFGLQQFGTPGGPTFTKVNQTGGTTYPIAAGSTGWGSEIALDVQWAHAIAPKANIILVEGNSASLNDLEATAVNWARQQPGVTAISMSFGIRESAVGSSITTYDQYFTTPVGHEGVSFFASSGNFRAPGLYPAYSSNVVAVGGTTLTAPGGVWTDETAWSFSGGGISLYQPKPTYQSAVTQSATQRTIPDVAMLADGNTGVPIYDSYGNGTGSAATPWTTVGGTSLAAPMFAGVASIANQGRKLAGNGTFDGPSQLLPKLYSISQSDYHDITTGTNATYNALPGYDLVTGRGTPVGSLIVPDLIEANAPGSPDLNALSDSGFSSTDNITNDTTPTFTGTATAGATVEILSDGVLVGSGIATGGNFSITTTALTDGPHVISARVTNAFAASTLNLTIDTIAPIASTPIFAGLTSQSLTSIFSENVNTPAISGANFVVDNLTTPQAIPAGQISVAYNSGSNTVTATFTTILPDGNYTAALSGIADLAGNAITGASAASFYFLQGDANQDRFVDTQDFNILAANFGGAGDFSQGNFNFDATIDSTDFNAFTPQYGKRLAAPSTTLASLPTPSGVVSNLFSAFPVSAGQIDELI